MGTHLKQLLSARVIVSHTQHTILTFTFIGRKMDGPECVSIMENSMKAKNHVIPRAEVIFDNLSRLLQSCV